MSENAIYKELITSWKWRTLRNQKIQENPVCEICEKEGKTTLATEVHHVLEIEKGRNRDEMTRRAFDKFNLQSLCRECHDKVHNKSYIYTSPKVVNKKKTKNFVDKFL
ncbi:MAG: HNH endonuclease [Bacteroidales bacterium]